MNYFLAPLGCGIQTGAGAVLNALKVEKEMSFAVFGAGAVGLAAIMAAAAAGATRIVAIDLVDSRLDITKSVGATHVINSAQMDASQALLELEPSGFGRTLDASGTVPAIELAIQALGNAGVCGLTSGPKPGQSVRLDVMNLMWDGRSIRGLVEGDSIPDVFIPRLIDMVANGELPVDKLVKEYQFEDIKQALEDAASGKTIEPVLCINHA